MCPVGRGLPPEAASPRRDANHLHRRRKKQTENSLKIEKPTRNRGAEVRSLPTSEMIGCRPSKKIPSTICYVIGYLLRTALSVSPPETRSVSIFFRFFVMFADENTSQERRER